MITGEDAGRDLAGLVVPSVGGLVQTQTREEPYRLVDATGAGVAPVGVFFRDLLAAGRSVATVRSYGMDLLRWWRFLAAVDVAWDRAGRVEARDFSCWIRSAGKPRRAATASAAGSKPAGAANAVTGNPSPGSGYAVATLAHSETVLRSFYDFHLETGDGPIVNPFPLDRSRRTGRPNAHHNPMNEFRHDRVGRYRPRVPRRVPRGIPDEWFDEIFVALTSDRDRALVAFWICTGVRASELLGMRVGDADPGQQLITVVRKGSRAVAQVPASPEAFVHLRIYQQVMRGLVPAGRNQPLWWTLRRPYRPLTYHAAHRMFERVNAALGSNWTLHSLRHSAARRMARDPQLPLTHVQAVMGHQHLSTTEVYLARTATRWSNRCGLITPAAPHNVTSHHHPHRHRGRVTTRSHWRSCSAGPARWREYRAGWPGPGELCRADRSARSATSNRGSGVSAPVSTPPCRGVLVPHHPAAG